jgi:hypothetical protein
MVLRDPAAVVVMEYGDAVVVDVSLWTMEAAEHTKENSN